MAPIVGAKQRRIAMRMRDDTQHQIGLNANRVLRRIENGQRRLWKDWLKIGAFLQMVRAEAMDLAGTNYPSGKGYSMNMSGLLKAYGLNGSRIKNSRADLLKIMDCLPEVEKWRSLQENRDELNHPSTVWNGFQRSSRQQDERDQHRKPNRAEQAEIDLALALEREVQKDAYIEELEAAREFSPPFHPEAEPEADGIVYLNDTWPPAEARTALRSRIRISRVAS
jgi:hypothetical protein